MEEMSKHFLLMKVGETDHQNCLGEDHLDAYNYRCFTTFTVEC